MVSIALAAVRVIRIQPRESGCYITPAPGGVGLMTVASLWNTLLAAEIAISCCLRGPPRA